MTSVLIVDDEKNLYLTLADILKDEGYEVTTADSGEAAVELCRRRSFDVVLMDVRMPGIDGVEAFRAIRALREDTRVIMMSAYSVERLENAALDEGAVAFLRKPLDLDGIKALIEGAAREDDAP